MMRLAIGGAGGGHHGERYSSLLLSCGHYVTRYDCLRSYWPIRVACHRCQNGWPINVDNLTSTFAYRDRDARREHGERRKPQALRATVLEFLPRCPWCRGQGGQNEAVCIVCHGWGVGAWDIGWCHALVCSAENVACLD